MQFVRNSINIFEFAGLVKMKRIGVIEIPRFPSSKPLFALDLGAQSLIFDRTSCILIS